MILEMEFEESTCEIPLDFGEVHEVSDGGYEKGYAEGEAVGYEKGHTAGVADGIEQGKQAEYDRFWDNFQDYGNRTNYNNAFLIGWTDENFNPKYPLCPAPNYCEFMFGIGCGITEIKEGVLDFSQLTTLKHMFYNNKVTVKIPPIDMTNITDIAGGFYGCSINPLVLNNVREDCVFGSLIAFGALKDFSMTGTIGTSINLQWSWQLSPESIKNIILHLKNLTGTDLAGVNTIKFHSDAWAKLEADGTTAPDGVTWKEYVKAVLCWNI